MPGLTFFDDPWVELQSVTYELSELEGCAVAIDATYFLQQMLDTRPSSEPLMCALAGLTGIHKYIKEELDRWEANSITPLFIFDGQPVVGQDDVTTAVGLQTIERSDAAWDLYFKGHASDAVLGFGASGNLFSPRILYPLLQRCLKERNLHFLVPPYNASAQIAYLDSIDSDQCAAIMGSQELLLYPINDCVIRSIAWDDRKVAAMSKKQIIKNLNVSESMFIDVLLMTGTSFLPPFPPLRDTTINPRQPSVMDASNMLRTSEKNMSALCVSFHDILQSQDANWLDKFRKARMIVDHYIYIAESGEVLVNDYDKLTGDNPEYLGFQLPSEAFHYLNTGLIGPALLSAVTHSKVCIQPTIDGYVTDEYRNLVTKQLVPIYKTALGLFNARLNRYLQFREIEMKVWFDEKFSLVLNQRGEGAPVGSRVAKWNVTKELLDKHFPDSTPGSLPFALSALAKKDFVSSVLEAPAVKGIESGDVVVSLAFWKWLTLQGYVDPKTLELTAWGVALSKTIAQLEKAVKANSSYSELLSAAPLAMELIRLGLLTSRNQHSKLQGLPVNGDSDAKSSIFLLSRAATLLSLRQESRGYKGPLSKNLLNYHSLAKTVASANRAVVDAVLASTFMNNQAKRDRSDYWEIGHRLPFYEFPDIALGIAVKTYLDELQQEKTAEAREARKKDFKGNFIPRATHLFEDLDKAFAFVDALYAGVETLGDEEMGAEDKADWERAKKYLDRNR